MKIIFMLICITIFSWIGWLLGAKIGFMTGYIFSVIGGMLGVYIGWLIKRNFME